MEMRGKGAGRMQIGREAANHCGGGGASGVGGGARRNVGVVMQMTLREKGDIEGGGVLQGSAVSGAGTL